jgi:hypothetical protein
MMCESNDSVIFARKALASHAGATLVAASWLVERCDRGVLIPDGFGASVDRS